MKLAACDAATCHLWPFACSFRGLCRVLVFFLFLLSFQTHKHTYSSESEREEKAKRMSALHYTWLQNTWLHDSLEYRFALAFQGQGSQSSYRFECNLMIMWHCKQPASHSRHNNGYFVCYLSFNCTCREHSSMLTFDVQLLSALTSTSNYWVAGVSRALSTG